MVSLLRPLYYIMGPSSREQFIRPLNWPSTRSPRLHFSSSARKNKQRRSGASNNDDDSTQKIIGLRLLGLVLIIWSMNKPALRNNRIKSKN